MQLMKRALAFSVSLFAATVTASQLSQDQLWGCFQPFVLYCMGLLENEELR
jgi:hypothetical protein